MKAARILVVEDESIVAWDLSQQLEEMGYSVCAIADNGEDAIAQTRRHRPDLILMDIVIKGAIDGIETARRIGTEFRMPVIFLTAYSDPAIVSRAVGTAPYGYLTKPFQAREIRAVIEVALSKAVLDRKLRESEQWLAAVLRCVSEGVVVTDPAGLIRMMNQAAETLLGVRSEEAAGQPADAILQFQSPASGAPVESPLRRALRGDTITSMDDGRLLIAPDGRRLPIDDSSAPLRTEDGHLIGAVLVFRDVSARVAAEERLRRSEARFHNAFQNAPIGVALVSLDGRFLEVNDSLCALLRRGAEQLTGRPQAESIHPDDCAAELRQRQRLLAGESAVAQLEIRYLAGEARVAYAMVSISVLREHHQPQCFLYQIHDVTARKDAEARLARLAYFDTLTGLANRAHLSLEMERLITAAHRGRRKLACMFIDVDHFKDVNDTLGHEAGDALLKAIAEGLKNCVREADCVGRHGGDEFVILLPEIASAEDIQPVVDKITQLSAQPVRVAGRELDFSLSIGVSLYPDDGTTAEDLFRCADSALYHAKSIGRDNLQFYRSELTSHLEQRTRTAHDLRRAGQAGEFYLVYEPIMLASGQHAVGAEALLRWNHPQLGLLHPNSFIAIAEDSGLIVPIGEWVINAACQHAAATAVVEGSPQLISVNISPRQFRSPGLVPIIRAALSRHGLPSEYLCLEITEQCLLVDNETSARAIADLKQLGVQIVIDDFGTGYSALRYIKRLGPGIIKIDQSFVHDVTNNIEDRAVIRAIIAMAHSLGIRVVAEGVENEEQRRLLSQEGCDLVQGYLYPPREPAGMATSPRQVH